MYLNMSVFIPGSYTSIQEHIRPKSELDKLFFQIQITKYKYFRC